MYTLTSNISIGGKTFNGVNKVVIKRSVNKVAAIANIIVPTTAVLKQQEKEPAKVEVAKQIAVGDFVSIDLGYDRQNNTEFKGFVKKIHYTTPLLVECEDYTWLLRRDKIQKSYKSTTLKQVVKDILNAGLEGYNLTALDTGQDISITNYVMATDEGEPISRADALVRLKDDYGLSVFFNTGGELYAGLKYGQQLGEVKYKLRHNVIDDDGLEFKKAEDVKIKIKAVHITSAGERTEVSVGDDSGDERTLFFHDVASKSELKELAQNELNNYKYDGYEGDITTFLRPFAQPAMVANLSDPVYSQRDGKYYIESVETTFGTNGARRAVFLGLNVN